MQLVGAIWGNTEVQYGECTWIGYKIASRCIERSRDAVLPVPLLPLLGRLIHHRKRLLEAELLHAVEVVLFRPERARQC